MSIVALHRELSILASLPENFGKAKSVMEANLHASTLGIKASFNIPVGQANIVNDILKDTLIEHGSIIDTIGTPKTLLLEFAKKILKRDSGVYNGEDIYESIRRPISYRRSRLNKALDKGKSFEDKCAEYVISKYERVPRIPKGHIAYHLNFDHKGMPMRGIGFSQENMKRYSLDSKHNNDGFHAIVGTVTGEYYTRHVTMHEIGHYLDHLLDDSIEWNYFKHNYYNNNIEEIETGLSIYAMQDEMEMVAEAYAEYKVSGNPRKVSVEIGTMLEKHVRELKS